MPWAFAVSAVLLIAEWLLTFSSPKLAAVLVYLHISGLGPILGSGFWLVATERFDPRTAKRKFGQIAAGGTFGGLLGGLLAERVAVMFGVGAMLPVLAILNLVCAWQVRRLVPAPTSQPQSKEFSAELTPEPAWSGVRALAETPYLRHLALLVLLGYGERGADRLRVQGTGGRGPRNWRKPPEILWRLLRDRQPRDIRRADLDEPVRPREVRARVHDGDAVDRVVCRRHRRVGDAWIRRRDCGPRLGIGVPRFAVPRRATRCSTRRFRPPKSARRNRLSTSASIASATRLEEAPSASFFRSRRTCNIPRSCS